MGSKTLFNPVFINIEQVDNFLPCSRATRLVICTRRASSFITRRASSFITRRASSLGLDRSDRIIKPTSTPQGDYIIS